MAQTSESRTNIRYALRKAYKQFAEALECEAANKVDVLLPPLKGSDGANQGSSRCPIDKPMQSRKVTDLQERITNNKMN